MKDFSQVRAAIGGLKGVLRALGDAPEHEHKWKNLPRCPFCGGKECSGVFTKGDAEFFKCHKPGCSSGNTVMAEVGYIAARKGLSDQKPAGGGPSPAYEFLLRLANCYEEPKAESPKSDHRPGAISAPLPNPVLPEETKLASRIEHPSPINHERASDGERKGERLEMEEPPGRLVLEEFYSRLTLTDADADTLFVKRGQTEQTSRRLGFVSNPVENRKILESLCGKFSADERLESGLWLPEDKKRKKEFRPNSQFFGYGQVGKKPGEQRKHRDDRWVWGWTHPILIPYFDEGGRLIKLTPHKGGAPGNTLSGAIRLYVPRDFKKARAASNAVETFPRVVICEGAFKAAALWETLGAGREDGGQPWGACAIPGINFGNNYDLRSELDAWLQAVQCRQVIVAFDDQDKSGKPMRERHEALIWARYLACDLVRTRHVRAKVLVLPKEWRDEKGKADWDGALAKLVNSPKLL